MQIAVSDLGFLVMSAKNAYFGQYKDHNSGKKNIETRQMTLFFLLLFLVCLLHSFLHFKIVEIHFHVVPTLINSGL